MSWANRWTFSTRIPLELVEFSATPGTYRTRPRQIEAVHKSRATIEFQMDGRIIIANGRFLEAMGYTLDEIKGKNHSMFVGEAVRNSPTDRAFLEKKRENWLADVPMTAAYDVFGLGYRFQSSGMPASDQLIGKALVLCWDGPSNLAAVEESLASSNYDFLSRVCRA